ncbi:Dabb family protein [Marinimicrobium alkaliphilum]|uniref:Dabb family protein n=1 Tax=Marinimicrobium alkaliphilum TaxID=2202654 RepID=UPI000DB9FFD4|nr:Dabb family protein [Marinimicrobium alkaliphilum]
MTLPKTSRRQFLAGATAAGAAALMPAASADHHQSASTSLPAVAHSVFFWLKNPDSAEDRAALIAGIKTLAGIAQVRGLHVGVPASTEQRDVVDSSYDVSELLFFDTAEDQDAYQVDPIHEQFVADCAHLWREVVVYDSVAV